MIEKILEISDKSTYDFRKHTQDNDPLKHLFPQWVSYYQLKHSISKALQPKSILEVGVRFGYSAISFLEGSPDASLTGIDIDSETYGGVKGALNWAKKITKKYDAHYIIEDTTKMKSFPGEFYDLIHVDAQQDGDGTIGDLKKALEKGRYILVDGYFWTKVNMLSSAYFLEKYKDFIEYALVIPGYAGELLIKTKPSAKHMFSRHKSSYAKLMGLYDEFYYLNDCGGHELFLRTQGKELNDHRLLASLHLAQADKTKRILDIGSGRGELAYALSKSALHVTGIDYSDDAIKIAQETFKSTKNLDFVHSDILKYNSEKKFDVILATDVVEHIEQDMLLKVFEKAKSLLSKGGILIIHTSPNKLKYVYEYSNNYKQAKRIGTYIPRNPRTHYEDMMHINEQTPATLNRGLKQSFDNVLVWTASAPDVLGNFDSKPDKKSLKEHDSIFAVASRRPLVKPDIISRLSQQPLKSDSLKTKIRAIDNVQVLKKNEEFYLNIEIQNNSNQRLASLLPFPVYIAYHWREKNNDNYVVFDGERTALNPPLMAHSRGNFKTHFIAPKVNGYYVLEISIVQEGQFWFEKVSDNVTCNLEIEVRKC